MTGLSRCGRVYPTFDAAYKAAEQRSFKGTATKVVSCSFGEHWHAIPAAEFVGQQKVYRPDPFPLIVCMSTPPSRGRTGGSCARVSPGRDG